jgi:hypothetical protein
VRPWAKFFPGFLAMAWVNMGPYPFHGITGYDELPNILEPTPEIPFNFESKLFDTFSQTIGM